MDFKYMGQWDFSFLLIQTFKKYREREKISKRKKDKIKGKFDLSRRKSPIGPYPFFCTDYWRNIQTIQNGPMGLFFSLNSNF